MHWLTLLKRMNFKTKFKNSVVVVAGVEVVDNRSGGFVVVVFVVVAVVAVVIVAVYVVVVVPVAVVC